MDFQDANPFPLNGLYFYLTDSCNLKCRHCWIMPKHRETRSHAELDYDLFRKIIEEAKPLGLIFARLTGGEPLLHSQIEKIVSFVDESNLVLDIESNGTLISPEFADRLGNIKKINIAISLDGMNDITHDSFRGVKGSFNKTIEGISYLKKSGINPELITCLSKSNKSQIQDMIHFAEDLRVRSLSFKIIAPIGRGEDVFRNNEVLSVEELIKIGEWFENELIPRSIIPVTFGHPLVFRKMSTLFGPRKKPCSVCGIKSILGVLPEGEFVLCGIGTLVKELRFGNAGVNNLADIWLDHKVITEIREGLPEKLSGICGICAMKKICRGSCIAQNYYLKNNLWSSYWYCEKAQELGLFPKSRMTKPV